MTQFIEKHRRLLQAYCLIARILGWVLLLGGAFWLIAVAGKVETIAGGDQKQIDFFLYILSALVYDFVIPGFLAFAIGGLLDYLLRPMKKPPLILGMTDKLCYIYAVFLVFKILPLMAFHTDYLFANLRYLTIIGTDPNTVSAAVACDNPGENSASHRHRDDTASFASRHRRIENAGLRRTKDD
jgi:hypothetical protein